jgi:hypothetical protein
MTGSWRARLCAVAAVALVAGTSLVTLGAGSGSAASTSTADPNVLDTSPPTVGSLRYLVDNAMAGDTILLQAGATYVLADGSEGLACDELRVTEDITIQSTSTTQNATIKQTCFDRVVKVDNSATLKNVTITGGQRFNSGAGIKTQSRGTLVLDGVEITGNRSDEDGGGIDAHGALTITNSTIADNCANGESGAIVAHTGTGAISITNSTITGNTQFDGGAVRVLAEGRPVTLTYVTLVDNTSTATANPCGIFPTSTDAGAPDDDADPLTPQDGTGAAAVNYVANLVTSINHLTSFGSVIGLPGGPASVHNCFVNSVTSSGYNFEQGGVDATSCGLTGGAGDVQNGADPALGALGANGGPTTTRVPQTGSPLLNMIPIAACGSPSGTITRDQRDVTRPQETGCEIGAVEILAVLAAVELQPRFTG